MNTGRREFLSTSLLAGAALSSPGIAAEGLNPIVKENAMTGTRDWMLTKPRIDPAPKFRCPWIEGYCSRTSVKAGEQIEFFVSTNPAAEFTIDVYRLGWYGGDGGRQVKKLGPFPGKVQA